MAIKKWEPFGDFDDLFNRLLPATLSRFPRLEPGMKVDWAPSADISESESEYLIRAELPGVKKEDIKIKVSDGVITLEGERRQEKEEKGEKVHRVERFYGSFSRSFALPENADVNSVKAESKEGLLTVKIPKLKSTPPRAVDVKVE
jgi:HSP20 family protein